MTGTARFIVFEGIDGSGKSTQCDRICRYAQSLGIRAVRLAEPSDGEWGRRVREMLRRKEMAPAEEQLRLFLMDRKDDAERNILPALQSGSLVVMDRYYFSNAAYQGAAGLPPDTIIRENRLMGVPEPDRVYFIDIPPGEAIRRVTAREEVREIFEKESFLARVREIFISLADERFVFIDGRLGVGEISDIIKNDFMTLL